MKTTISDFIIAFFDLVEAEGRELKKNTKEIIFDLQRSIFNSLISILGIIIIGIIFLIAIFSFALGLFLWMKTFLNIYISAFLLSFIFFIIGIILFFLLKKQNERG